jgi:hypothetical protein
MDAAKNRSTREPAGHADADRERTALRHVTDTLAAEVDGEHTQDEVSHAVDETAHRYDQATVREFVPIMVEREAREALRRAS